jgi:16S rRNA (guanine527-N7)-methyltransferase
MEFNEFKIIFLEELKNNEIDLNLSDDQLKLFFDYMKELIEWNEKINVTAITDEKMFIVKHYIDSLTVSKYLEHSKKIIDIGTGGGFPGIPLKIINKEKEFTLIDSVNKKLNVIREISKNIKLEKLEIIHTRAEDLAQKNDYREKYDIATTRAVSNFTTIIEYMLPFVKVNGIAICMKGPNYKDELEEAKKAIEILGGKIEKIDSYNLGKDNERNNIIIRKIKQTPKKYPRGQGKPLKEPIR